MNARVFTRVYTAKQLNRGEGMIYHPITGDRLRHLTYLRDGVFAVVIEPPYAAPLVLQRLRQIGERQKLYPYGSSYPIHWRFDPWTGERLECEERQSKGGMIMLADAKSFAETQKRQEEVLRFLRGRLTPELYERVVVRLRGCYIVHHETDGRGRNVRR